MHVKIQTDKWQTLDYVQAGMLARNKTWRAGQGLFNALELIIPEFANDIRGTRIDPFHDNSKIQVCLIAAYEYIEKIKENPNNLRIEKVINDEDAAFCLMGDDLYITPVLADNTIRLDDWTKCYENDQFPQTEIDRIKTKLKK